jgi:Mlc titration factor MtfA (ptsG expression regulator)
VVIHGFAHKVDITDGEAGGTPPISDLEALRDFERVADETLAALRTEGSPVLRPYAGTNRAEPFAVGTGAFFPTPPGSGSPPPRVVCRTPRVLPP